MKAQRHRKVLVLDITVASRASLNRNRIDITSTIFVGYRVVGTAICIRVVEGHFCGAARICFIAIATVTTQIALFTSQQSAAMIPVLMCQIALISRGSIKVCSANHTEPVRTCGTRTIGRYIRCNFDVPAAWT